MCFTLVCNRKQTKLCTLQCILCMLIHLHIWGNVPQTPHATNHSALTGHLFYMLPWSHTLGSGQPIKLWNMINVIMISISHTSSWFSLVFFSINGDVRYTSSAIPKMAVSMKTTHLLHGQAHCLFWKLNEAHCSNSALESIMDSFGSCLTAIGTSLQNIDCMSQKCEVLDKNNKMGADAKIGECLGSLRMLRGEVYDCLLVKSFLLLDLTHRSHGTKLKWGLPPQQSAIAPLIQEGRNGITAKCYTLFVLSLNISCF